MYNTSFTTMDLPPLPSYTTRPLPPLVPGISDAYLSLILPIVAYWGFSMIFHFIDEHDLFPQYRLHTPAEVLKRNHVSRLDVLRDVLIQQVIQVFAGLALTYLDPEVLTGKDDYNVAVWAQRIRIAQRTIPQVLAVTGLDAKALAQKALIYSPSVAGALAGGFYPAASQIVDGASIPAFSSWEILAAKAIYWVIIPAIQFLAAILVVDTWQYFLHRAMHMNKWLYTSFHSRHHRLYVPYAYGALYNHPVEGFCLDTLGAGLAYLISGMTPRQGMCFFVGSTIKTVDDHCGYALPWDPLQHLTSNNAGYHDVHHQSWGIKTNFSQPFFTFWDALLGTKWVGGDISARYERARLAAEKKTKSEQEPITKSKAMDSVLDASDPAPFDPSVAAQEPVKSISNASTPTIPAGKARAQAAESRAQILADPSPAGGISVLAKETAEEERETTRLLRRSPRKRQQSATLVAQQAGKGLRERVTGSAGVRGHGIGKGKVLGYESGL